MNISEQQGGQRILTMVSLDLWSPDGYHGRMREAVAAGQKQAEEGALAPLIKTLQETGLFDAGFTIALAAQMPAFHWDDPGVTSAVRDRLSLARGMIRDRVNLLALPESMVSYGHAVPLLGNRVAGSVASIDGDGYQLY